MKYYITGVNKLTGERDRLTPPIALDLAQDLIEKEQTRRRRFRLYHCAYDRLRIVEAESVQLELLFT